MFAAIAALASAMNPQTTMIVLWSFIVWFAFPTPQPFACARAAAQCLTALSSED